MDWIVKEVSQSIQIPDYLTSAVTRIEMILSKGLGFLAKFGAVGVAGTSSLVYLDHIDALDLTDSTFIRGVRTALTTCSIISDYKFSLHGIDENSSDYEALKSEAHHRSADKLLKLVWKNRGTYVKVGQHLGGMDYLLPKEYTETLRILHSSAPQSDVEEIKRVVTEELNVDDISEVFCEFSPEPLGTASLAQCHKAKLKSDGTVVAVKVQHPKVKLHAQQDMDMMTSALNLVLRFFPEFEFMWISEETKENLPVELNFTNEVRNCLRATDNLKCFPWVKLPEVYPEYCSSRVLTMEFLDGHQCNDTNFFKSEEIEFSQVSRLLGKLFSEMIFVHGFVHSDPHPGNILVRRKPPSETSSPTSFFSSFFKEKDELEIMLIDHGLYRELSEEFRYKYAHLWQSIIRSDNRGIEKWSRELGSAEMYPLLATIVTGRSWDVVGGKGVHQVQLTDEEDEQIRDGVGDFLVDISHVLNRIPREMLLVLKTNDHLRGLEHFYGVRGHASGFIDMSKCCLRALNQLEWSRAGPGSGAYIFSSISLRMQLLQISIFEWFMWLYRDYYEDNDKQSSAS